MIEVLKTDEYANWFDNLRDAEAQRRILARLRRVALGNFGDTKMVAAGIWELRIDYGPGYRVYFARRDETIVWLLAGGDKRKQSRDIATAMGLLRALKE